MQVVAREDGFVFFAVKHQFAVAADPHVGDVFVVAEIQLDAFFEVVEGVDAEVAVAADNEVAVEPAGAEFARAVAQLEPLGFVADVRFVDEDVAAQVAEDDVFHAVVDEGFEQPFVQLLGVVERPGFDDFAGVGEVDDAFVGVVGVEGDEAVFKARRAAAQATGFADVDGLPAFCRVAVAVLVDERGVFLQYPEGLAVNAEDGVEASVEVLEGFFEDVHFAAAVVNHADAVFEGDGDFAAFRDEGEAEGAAGQRDFLDVAGFEVNEGDGVAALVANRQPGFVGAAGEGADGDGRAQGVHLAFFFEIDDGDVAHAFVGDEDVARRVVEALRRGGFGRRACGDRRCRGVAGRL